MNSGIATQSLRRQLPFSRHMDVAVDASTGDGWLPHRISGLLPEQELGCLDVVALARILHEAERIMANTTLLLRSAMCESMRPLMPHANDKNTSRHPKACSLM